MKTLRLPLTLALGVGACLVVTAMADDPVSTSASFTLLPAPVGPGGGQVSGAGGITAETSIGDAFFGGVSAETGLGVEDKGGYTGQLYDAQSVAVTATPATVNEGADRQLDAAAVMDDDTELVLDPADLIWGVVSGPVTGIDADGLATAGIVYENTPATVRGTWLGMIGDFELTVVNVDSDDYRSYAGDGLDDDWQVGFFGEENPDAAPGKDPDGDQQDNLFENLAGGDPTDPFSFFDVDARRSTTVGQWNIIFSPRLVDRNYRVFASTLLTDPSWTEVTGGTITDNGNERTITDPNATETRKFYRVEITRP